MSKRVRREGRVGLSPANCDSGRLGPSDENEFIRGLKPLRSTQIDMMMMIGRIYLIRHVYTLTFDYSYLNFLGLGRVHYSYTTVTLQLHYSYTTVTLQSYTYSELRTSKTDAQVPPRQPPSHTLRTGCSPLHLAVDNNKGRIDVVRGGAAGGGSRCEPCQPQGQNVGQIPAGAFLGRNRARTTLHDATGDRR
eukprot:1188346-Prorocentrum_minimum.AAC.2